MLRRATRRRLTELEAENILLRSQNQDLRKLVVELGETAKNRLKEIKRLRQMVPVPPPEPGMASTIDDLREE